jgi:GNAT superfamily N-acetyltransferase
MARSTPPAKLRVTRRGAVEILDGNHRVALWGERGFTHVPAWVIDERGHRAAVAAALAAGRRVPEAVRASYPDLLLTRPNPPPKGTRVSAYEEMGELWVEARSADGSFLGRVRVSMTDSYDERACGDLVPQAAEAVGADGLWLMTVNSSYVSPAYRGRGIGKALYLMALREARRRGAAIAPDTCAWGSTSPDARRVWESDEFRAAAVVVGRWPYVVAVPRKEIVSPQEMLAIFSGMRNVTGKVTVSPAARLAPQRIVDPLAGSHCGASTSPMLRFSPRILSGYTLKTYGNSTRSCSMRSGP